MIIAHSGNASFSTATGAGVLINPFDAAVPLFTTVATRTVNGADAPISINLARGNGLDSQAKHTMFESSRLRPA
jgi:hypothetical protein